MVNRMITSYRKFLAKYYYKFVFIHINKTGGSSIEKALNLPFEHKTAKEKIDELGQDLWLKKISFSVIRNPWDKVVSHYHYRVKTNQTGMGDKHIDFNSWVKLSYGEKDIRYYDQPKMFMPQVEWLKNSDGQVCVMKILRFESIESDFNNLMKELGLKASLPHLKKTDHRNYVDYYDNESRKIVKEVFAEDIEFFGYLF